jgi:hypothetical protein
MIGKVLARYNSQKACFDKYGDLDKTPQKCSEILTRDCYAELLGRTDPQSSNDACFGCQKDKKDDSAPIIYENFWSVGICGSEPNWYEKLDGNDSIVVQLILHTGNSAYSIQPVTATLKQLPPFKKTLGAEIVDWFKMISPILDNAGKILDIANVPVAGKVLSTVSEMQLNNIRVSDFPWYIKTFSTCNEAGIEWHIPHDLVQLTGNLLVGSIGVYFIKSSGDSTTEPSGNPSIEIRAFLRVKDGGKTELFITPADLDNPTKLIIKPV